MRQSVTNSSATRGTARPGSGAKTASSHRTCLSKKDKDRDRLTTQLIRLPPEKAKSKNAPKHVEAFVCGSIPNGPRLKSAVDMLYVCRDRFVR